MNRFRPANIEAFEATFTTISIFDLHSSFSCSLKDPVLAGSHTFVASHTKKRFYPYDEQAARLEVKILAIAV